MTIYSITDLGKKYKLSEGQIKEFTKTYWYGFSVGIIGGLALGLWFAFAAYPLIQG